MTNNKLTKGASGATEGSPLRNRVAVVVLFPLFGKYLQILLLSPAPKAHKYVLISVAQWFLTFILHNNKALHWRQRLALTFLQAQRASFPAHILRWLLRGVSSGDAILQHCDKHNIAHRIVTIDDAMRASSGASRSARAPPATLHLLTPPGPGQDENAPTLLYFHGGGFVNPLRGAAHMPFIMRCAASCRAKQVAILEYSLAPEHPYPAQLIQCVAALRYLLQEMHMGLEDIVLAGDSAGGQLVGALLAHLTQPSPYAVPVKVTGRFRAALFVSPFVRLPTSTDVGSYESNEGRDYLSRAQVDGFNAAWKGNEDDIWANLSGVQISRKVWSKVFARNSQGLVRKALITVGTAEVFLDCCRRFAQEHAGAEIIRAGRDTDWKGFEGNDIVLAECEGEVHVQVALDSVVHYHNGAMERAIMSWLAIV